ncbi:TonB family protein [Succinimonas amylolytica]|uniref:TonB family protein n=1 Tax=Succinimonas amylolytica TaxID=83769 RepID=UPI00036D043A|nr:TonB family protein [Succinimonas amylolytica]
MKLFSGDFPERTASLAAVALFPVLTVPAVYIAELLWAVPVPAVLQEKTAQPEITGSFYAEAVVRESADTELAGDSGAPVLELESVAEKTVPEAERPEEKKQEKKREETREETRKPDVSMEIRSGPLSKPQVNSHARGSRGQSREKPENRRSGQLAHSERKPLREANADVRRNLPEKPIPGTAMTENATKISSGSPPQPPSRSLSSEGSHLKGAALIRKEAERLRKYPPRALRNGIQGSGALLARVNSRGVVYSAMVVRNTGNRFLDQALENLAEKITGFDTGIPGEAYEVEVPVRYLIK